MKQMIKIFLLPILCIIFTSCQTFRGNRKPQAAGFGGYCPECLMNNIDKDLAQLKNIVKIKHKSVIRMYVNVNTKCKKGWVEGRKFKISNPRRSNSNNNANLIGAINVTLATGDSDFIWHIFTPSDDSSHKECLKQDTLPKKYETHLKAKCAKGYQEGKHFDNRNPVVDDYDSKECIAISQL